MREWTSEDFEQYASRLNLGIEQREAVLKALAENTLLKDFLDTTNGRMLLNKTVDSIRNLVMNIVTLSTAGAKENIEEIVQSALLIKVSVNFMTNIASLYVEGQKKLEEINGG